LTNNALLLVFIGAIFLIESASVIIQTLSKRLRHKKVFLSSPIHHHFQAMGWPESKIVMRFWVLSGLGIALALIIFLLDKQF